MVEGLAERLQQLVAELTGVTVPIVEVEAGDKPTGPVIAIIRTGFGDIYSGDGVVEEITLRGVIRDRRWLTVRFSFAEHQLSGQCDEWTLSISGAKDEERERFFELFHPRQRTGSWNQHHEPSFEFNGTKSPYA